MGGRVSAPTHGKLLMVEDFSSGGERMQRFLFHFLELFSFIGDGTPENPGGDFGMSC
jgi:hypothetical protein